MKLCNIISIQVCEHVEDPDVISKIDLSRDMRFPTMWYVLPAKAKTSLRIRAV